MVTVLSLGASHPEQRNTSINMESHINHVKDIAVVLRMRVHGGPDCIIAVVLVRTICMEIH